MVFWQGVQHFAHGQDSPAISPSPMEGSMRLHGFHPAVTKQSFFFHKHTFAKLFYLSYGLVKVSLFTSQPSHLYKGGNAHEHVVKPYSVLMRAKTGKSAICQSVFLIYNIVSITVNAGTIGQVLIGHKRLDHSRTDSTSVIQGMWVYHFAHEWIYFDAFLMHISVGGCTACQQSHALQGVLSVCFVTSSFSSCQHSRVGNTPFVAGQSEVTSA